VQNRPAFKLVESKLNDIRITQDNPYGFHWADNFRRKVQDDFIAQKRLQEKKAGDSIKDESNAYRFENLSKGIILRLSELFFGKHFDPFTKYAQYLSKEFGVTAELLDDYLKAKHAPEVNERFNKLYKTTGENYSGMENHEQIVADFEALVGQTEADILWDKVRAINQYVIDRWFESGLISAERKAQLESMYEYYVPLRGFEEIEYDNTFYSTDYKQGGRKSKPGSAIGYMMVMAQTAIIQGQKNLIKQRLLNFVQEFPDSKLYRTVFPYYVAKIDPATGLIAIDPATGKQIWDETTERPKKALFDAGLAKNRINPEADQVSEAQKQQESVITVMVDGQKVYIVFADTHIPRAFSKWGVDELPFFMRLLRPITRYMASMRTSYSPEFIPTNFLRDMTEGTLNLFIDRGLISTAKFLSNVPKSMAALWAYSFTGNLNSKNKTHRYLEEFLNNGAITGYSDMKDVGEFFSTLEYRMGKTKANKSLMERIYNSWLSEGPANVLGVIEKLNRVTENAARLAVFIEMRESRHSPEQAAIYAKDLTVNFNRKGEWGNTIGSVYMFFNAAVQGGERVTRKAPGREGAKIDKRRWAATALALPASAIAMSMLARVLGGKDDDDEYYYDKESEWSKMHNFYIPTGNGDFVKIPMPYGWNFFFGTGVQLSDVMLGNTKPSDAALNTVTLGMESFMPFGEYDFGKRTPDLMTQTFEMALPSVLKPFHELSVNRNFAGGQIYKEPSPWQKADVPQYQLGLKSTGKQYKFAAEKLNELTGGNEVEPGFVNINPAKAEYLVGQVFGGVGSTASKAIGTTINVLEGENLFKGDNLRQVPFAGRFTSSPRQSSNTRIFYDNIRSISGVKENFDQLIKLGNRTAAVEYRKEHFNEYRLYEVSLDYQKQAKELSDAINRMKANDPKKYREQIRNLEEKQNNLYIRFNKLYNRFNQANTPAREILNKFD
jgi:hypothetical protein